MEILLKRRLYRLGPTLAVSEFSRPGMAINIFMSNKLLSSDADGVPSGPHFEKH